MIEAVVQAVRANFEAAQLRFLRRLVDQPSYTRAPDDVEVAAQILDAEAEALGLSVRRVPNSDGQFAAHRIYATGAVAKDEPALALVGHVDTVFPRSLGFLEFSQDGDIMRGPGVLDMKGGLSVIFGALRAVRDAAPERYATLKLRVLVVTDEEVGSPSSRALYKDWAPLVSGAMVFEAGRTGDAVIVARKGTGELRVTASGQAAHAGLRHDEGINAIHALALAIPRLEALTDYGRGTTVNVGLVSGGTARNTVPDEAMAVVDLRFVRVADGPALVAAARAAVGQALDGLPKAHAKIAEAKIKVEGGVARPPMEASEANEALRQMYAPHAKLAGVGGEAAPLQGGGSDANLLAALGVPVIDGLGPYGQGFHRVDEWASVESLRKKTEALARMLVGG